MEGKKLDRLFEEKLARHEIAPDPSSWSEVAGQLNQEKKPIIWWRAAAAVALLITAGVVIMLMNNQHPDELFIAEKQASEVETVELAVEPLKESAIASSAQSQEIQSVPEKPKTLKKRAVASQSSPKTLLDEKDVMIIANPETEIQAPPSLASMTPDLVPRMAPELQIIGDEEEVGFDVQITYIASHVEPKSTKNGLGKLLERARELDPGDVWASIRDSKDDLFRSSKN